MLTGTHKVGHCVEYSEELVHAVLSTDGPPGQRLSACSWSACLSPSSQMKEIIKNIFIKQTRIEK